MTDNMVQIEGHSFSVSNLDKVFFPDDEITKGDLIEYYVRVAEVMLPHTKGRPISMQRFPNGITGEGFYQKETPDYYPDWIVRARVEVGEANGTQPEVVVDNAATLAYLANQGCITIHTWLSRMDKLDYPDKMVIDLDPPPGGFEPARKVARQLAEIYKEVGLVPYLMITGSKGLHVVAPLDRKSDFTTVRAFARDLVEWIAEKDPEHLTINARDHRKTRMFLDYLRNAYSATAVAPYSVRARPGAPVATPLEWDELGDKKLKSDKYNIKNISRRLARKGDVMKDMMKDAGSVKDARVRLDSLIGGTKAGATKARK